MIVKRLIQLMMGTRRAVQATLRKVIQSARRKVIQSARREVTMALMEEGEGAERNEKEMDE